MSRRGFSVAISLALLLFGCDGGRPSAPLGRALTDYPDCTELGAALVDHSCFHTINGPFVTVDASPTRDFVSGAPNVNPVHTHYTVRLPASLDADAGSDADVAGSEGTVKYRPARTGDWSVFTNPVVPMLVLDPAGAPVPVELAHPITTCPLLATVSVVHLTANVTYRLVLGPTAVNEVSVVLEKLADFETSFFADQDGDGRGNAAVSVATACKPPAGYVVDDTDCDDTSAAKHPAAVEMCNGEDDNCDGVIDEGACAVDASPPPDAPPPPVDLAPIQLDAPADVVSLVPDVPAPPPDLGNADAVTDAEHDGSELDSNPLGMMMMGADGPMVGQDVLPPMPDAAPDAVAAPRDMAVASLDGPSVSRDVAAASVDMAVPLPTPDAFTPPMMADAAKASDVGVPQAPDAAAPSGRDAGAAQADAAADARPPTVPDADWSTPFLARGHDGCSCQVGSSAQTGSSAFVLFLLVAAFLRWRRRKPR